MTLTTDFGGGSPYVAAMKGVILAACPEAVLVDVSHAVAPFDVRAASFVLWAGTRSFAAGTVHLAVVDPGVGTERRRLAVQAGGSFYVGPDNGVLDRVLDAAQAPVEAVALPVPAGASATFEGRDVFAPAAAALAAGTPLRDLGEPATPAPAAEGPPAVLWVDAFGNLVTSLRPPVEGVMVGGTAVRRGARTYGEAQPGQLFFYTGSLGLVEVGLRESRADLLLGAGPGTPVSKLP